MTTNVPIGELKVADDNIRTEVGDITELVASVKTAGVIEPLLVREDDKLVVCGSRRLAAAKKAGLTVVPCLLRAFTEQERFEAMLIENLQREDLSPSEEAAAFKRLLDLGVKNQTELAKRLGVSKSHVSKRLSLLDLSEEIRGAVDKGAIKLDVAHQLTRVGDDEELVGELADKLMKTASGQGNSPEYVQQAVTHDIDRELARRVREQKVKELRTKLEKAGETIVEAKYDAQGWNVSLPEGHAFVAQNTYREDVVDLDPKKHAKLACHGVAISGKGEVEAIEVCTDTSKHPNKAEQQKEARQKENEKRQRIDAAWNKVVARRREWLSELVNRRVPHHAVIEFVWIAFATESNWSYGDAAESDLAAELLGLQLELVVTRKEAETKYNLDLGDDESEEITIELDADEALDEFAAKNQTNRQSAVIALAIARLEPGVSAWHGAFDNTDVAYFNLLEQLGYELGREETKRRKQRMDGNVDGARSPYTSQAA